MRQRSPSEQFQVPELDASLRAFYGDDSRRARSSERDLGLRWRARDGSSYRVAWVAETGELYSVRHGDSGADDRLDVLARVDGEAVQRALDSGAPIWVLNHLYFVAQFAVVPGALIWLYGHSPAIYRTLRNTVLATWLIAVPIYALYPVAPPRLAGIGILDTISDQSEASLNSHVATSFYNPFAAVPSLHAGFAFAVGIALAVALRRRWAKALALLWC